MVVNSGTFLDSAELAGSSLPRLTAVSAASFQAGAAVAPDSIISIFGSRMAEVTEVAETLPLPLRLGGVQVIASDGRASGCPRRLSLYLRARLIAFCLPKPLPDK